MCSIILTLKNWQALSELDGIYEYDKMLKIHKVLPSGHLAGGLPAFGRVEKK